MDAAYNPAAWNSFFSAQVSASAALTGLIFVAVSINLDKIVTGRILVSRSALALVILLGVLLGSICCLVPGQPAFTLGCELAPLGAAVWLAGTILQHRASHNNPYVSRWQKLFHTVLTQLSMLPSVVAGASLLLARGGGLYWLLAGSVFSFTAALIDAWVLLIEIQR
jgi:hypothetical protein